MNNFKIINSGNSTLLNASKATNFTYRIEGNGFTDEEIDEINNINPAKNKVIERYNAIIEKGGFFVFDNIENKSFSRNLAMLDGDMARFLASMLITQLDNRIKQLPELIDVMSETDPLNFGYEDARSIYVYKIKHLLTSSALGMMPATAWSGRYDANGGYIVVKEDGEILCYHFYDRNRFEDYLFENAYLERSDIKRHEYAVLYKDDDGILKFKINLQIRLK